jgi:Family of unknown function (DUF5709)
MSGRDYDNDLEDDGVIEPGDSLDSDDLRADVLDTGVDAGEGYVASTRWGTTWDEEHRGESLDQLLSQEEKDVAGDDEWTDEETPRDDDRAPFARAGRLVASDEGVRADVDNDLVAFDAGVDGGGASAEEAAMHLTDDPPFEP